MFNGGLFFPQLKNCLDNYEVISEILDYSYQEQNVSVKNSEWEEHLDAFWLQKGHIQLDCLPPVQVLRIRACLNTKTCPSVSVPASTTTITASDLSHPWQSCEPARSVTCVPRLPRWAGPALALQSLHYAEHQHCLCTTTAGDRVSSE